MRDGWPGPGIARTARAFGLALLMASGCSQQEEAQPDPGVSPFYDGPAAGANGGTPAVPGRPPAAGPTGGSLPGGSLPGGSTPAGPAGVDISGLDGPTRVGPIARDDIERQLRIAQRAATKGDTARATAILDRILEVQPDHREAIFGRAAIAMGQTEKADSPEKKAAAARKAGELVRRLRATFERLNRQELEVVARVLYDEIHRATKEGRFDQAAAVVKEVNDAGFEPFDRIDHDDELVKLRDSQAYRAIMAKVDAERLAFARLRAKGHLAKPPGFAFDFHLKDLDGKPISLDQYRGKVVLVDIWGTWCKPCRDALPSLVEMYYKHRRRGFDIVGLAYEPNAPDAQTALHNVKDFVKQSGIPYRCAMGDDATQKKIPDFRAFPTTLLIDRAGKVRVLVTENTDNTLKAMDDDIEILLAEPAPTEPKARTAEPKPTTAAPSPAPAAKKGSAPADPKPGKP